MKVVAFADTHGAHEEVQIPDGDVLIFSGDMCYTGDIEDVFLFGRWLGKLPHRYKIVIAGNHDRPFEHRKGLAQAALGSCYYLENRGCMIDGVYFYGSPYTPEFNQWHFMLPRGDAMQANWEKIPANTDVLITHGPPAGILDATSRGEQVGCCDLALAVDRIRPRYHVFGHIHGQRGEREFGGTRYINCSVCDETYDPIQCPAEFNIEKEE